MFEEPHFSKLARDISRIFTINEKTPATPSLVFYFKIVSLYEFHYLSISEILLVIILWFFNNFLLICGCWIDPMCLSGWGIIKSCRINGCNKTLFFLLLEKPPVCAPYTIKTPPQFFEHPLSGSVPCAGNKRTVITGTIAFDGQNVFASFLNDNVQTKFAGSILAFNFITFVFKKLYNLFFKRRVAINNILDTISPSLKAFAADAEIAGLFGGL